MLGVVDYGSSDEESGGEEVSTGPSKSKSVLFLENPGSANFALKLPAAQPKLNVAKQVDDETGDIPQAHDWEKELADKVRKEKAASARKGPRKIAAFGKLLSGLAPPDSDPESDEEETVVS